MMHSLLPTIMANFFEPIFEFLFKYRAATFSKGNLVFGAPLPSVIIVLMAAMAIAFAVVTYRRVKGRSTNRERAVLITLRVAVLAVLMLCLTRPMLLLSTALPQRNYIGIIVDDSRSMQIADAGGDTRSNVAGRFFGRPDAALMQELSDKFLIRYYSFSSNTQRRDGVEDLSYEGRQTRIMDAIERARQELSSVPLAGLVLVSDGADNTHSPLGEQLLSLKAQGVPVYTVGLGAERFERDVEITRVDAPRSALKGASVMVDLTVTQRGYAGKKVRLVVEDAGRIVSSQEITLPADGEAAPVRVHATANDAGPRVFNFRIPLQEGELIAENNEQEALIVISDKREKILYFEGEPRFEVKFIRRAVNDDPNLQLVLLQRTAENKFLRLNVDDGDELIEGFPRTREELFEYRALILGSVEASFFTADQLRMIADFVSERGGGLLMLGGRQSFSEGGYAGTSLADVIPLTFPSARATASDEHFVELGVSLTPAGMIHAATRLAPGETESAERWKQLPHVSSVNRISGLKPGATELIAGATSARGGGQPVLAYQRYGRGKVIAMPVQDTWMWQMHADIPVEDETHETFWRQLTRWLVNGVPGTVNVLPVRDRVAPEDNVVLRAEINDKQYVRLNNAEVKAFISGPDLVEREVPMEWTVDRDGEYRAAFTPGAAGLYRVRAEGRRGDTILSADTTYVQSAELQAEYFGAQMNAPLLRRIADETGGTFYTPDRLDRLPEDMTLTTSGATVMQQLDLWDMPVIFLLLVGLVGGEWFLRKRRGLA